MLWDNFNELLISATLEIKEVAVECYHCLKIFYPEKHSKFCFNIEQILFVIIPRFLAPQC